MPHDGRAIANFILDVCEEKGHVLTNLAVQKIAYFCHAWSLALLDRPLVISSFEAWQYGPVLPYLYREFSTYRDAPIVGRASSLDLATGERVKASCLLSDEEERLVRDVVGFYSRLRPYTLVAFSHEEGGPWERLWNQTGGEPGMVLEDEEIADFFKSKTPPF